jgi:hypothetical protein
MWGMDWIQLAQDRQVAGTCECGNEPSGSINFLANCKPVSLSSRTLLHGGVMDPGICLYGLRKTTNEPCQVTRCPGLDSSLSPPDYK